MTVIKLDEVRAGSATAEALSYGRRLSDKILVAFHHACDKGDILTAEDLLKALSGLIARPVATDTHDRRKVAETQADANYRLWDLKRQQSAPPQAERQVEEK